MSSPLHLGKYRVSGKPGTLEIYKQLKGIAFNEYHDLFSLCVFLGYKNQKKMTVRRQREQLFWSDTFSKREYAAFYALIINDSDNEDNADYELLKDGEKMLEFLQDYADGGLQFFLESDIMKKYVKEKDGNCLLDFTSSDHIQKQIMYYVYNMYQQL